MSTSNDQKERQTSWKKAYSEREVPVVERLVLINFEFARKAKQHSNKSPDYLLRFCGADIFRDHYDLIETSSCSRRYKKNETAKKATKTQLDRKKNGGATTKCLKQHIQLLQSARGTKECGGVGC
jgi:hypothetical protein